MDEPRPRLRTTLGAVVVLVLVGLGCAVLVAALGDHGSSAQVVPTTPPTAAAQPGGAVFVHVLGAVQRPGLYELREGARAVDAVAAAGGFLPSADQTQVNLARFVTDGEQIVVPEQGAAPPPAPAGASPGGLLNLNTADAAALEELPGIGPALAARIVDWREANGRFTAVDDLQQVSGIGDKTFAELKELVTV